MFTSTAMRVAAVADVDRGGLGHLSGVGVVDVAVARRGDLRPTRVGEDLDGGLVLERQPVVQAGRVEPEVDHLLDLLRMLGGEVMALGGVLVGVEQLPAVLVEVAPAGDRRMHG